MVGRPRKPTALKEAEGTARPDRAVNEPRPMTDIPKIPPHLSKEAKKEWRRSAEELASLNLISRIDRATFAAYCETWSDWVDACEKVKEFGKVIKTKSGNFIENPYFSIKKRCAE